MSPVWFLYAAQTNTTQTQFCLFSKLFCCKNGRAVRSSSTNPVIQTLHFLDKRTHVVKWGESFHWKATLSGSNITAHGVIVAKAAKRNQEKHDTLTCISLTLKKFYQQQNLNTIFKCSQSSFGSSPDLLFYSFFFKGKQLEKQTYHILPLFTWLWLQPYFRL